MELSDAEPGGGGSPKSGSRAAIMVLLACLALYFCPRFARGEVLYPHTGSAEAGVAREAADGLKWWYLDVGVLYVPEIAVHLDPNRKSWLATWTPHNGLGRPLFHVGVGPAFVLTRVVAQVTSDPFVHYTWMASLGVVLSALFAFGFLAARGLHPAACLGAALAVSVGPLYPTWPMIPLVQWGFAWAFAALWATETWCQRRSVFSLLAIAFAVHGILLTGFLEHTLGLGWMVGGWVALRTWGATEAKGKPVEGRGRLFGGVVAAAALGVLSVLPVYADLLLEVMASTRLDEVNEFGRALEGRVWPSIFAVVAAGAPGLESFSLGATSFALMVLGVVRVGGPGRRRINGAYWFAWAAFMAAATSNARVHGWLSFFGLGMSSWPPVLTIFVPVAYLIALGLHDLFTQASPSQRRWQLLAVAATLAAGVAGHVVNGPAFNRPLDRTLLVAACVPALLLCLFISSPFGRTRFVSLLIPLALFLPDGWTRARNLVAWKDRTAIHTESNLSRELQRRTRDGSRYVWVSDRPVRSFWMPPNMDAVLKTRGLQSYDHLPTREFHSLVEPLRPEKERKPYIRRFTRLGEPDALLDDGLVFAGVGTVLSRQPLDPALGKAVKVIDGVVVSRPARTLPPRFSVALDLCEQESDGEWRVDLDAIVDSAEAATVLDERNDSLDLTVSDRSGNRLLFLSQHHHPHWCAVSNGRPLETVRVNGLFQGVVLPADVAGDATRVELEFRPWSPWIVVSQVGFVFAALLWWLSRMRRLFRSGLACGRGALLLLCIGLVSGFTGCGPATEGEGSTAQSAPQRPDVYVLMADTFRADNLGLKLAGGLQGETLCPELDDLARGARRFVSARTPATWTLPAHASLFTGLYPKEIGVVDAGSTIHPGLETLAEAFATAGYRTAAVTDAGYVSARYGMDQGFESFVTTGNMVTPDFNLTVAAVEEALDRPGDDRPLFLFVQSYRAHSWTVSGATRERLGPEFAFQPDEVFTSKAWRGRFLDLLRVADHGVPMSGSEFDEVVRSMVPNYRGAAADTSLGFGRVLDLLRARPRFQESAVVFTSDHGEAFGLHGVVSHGNGVWDEQGQVPLLISAPWVAAGEDERPASLIDLPRTLAGLAGIDPMDAWRGTDLLAADWHPRPIFQFQTLPAKTCYVAMVEGGVKWIFVDEGEAPGRLAFVYDLVEDPQEKVNLAEELGGGDREARTRRALSQTMRSLPLPEPGADGQEAMGEELLEQLRGMGYGPR